MFDLIFEDQINKCQEHYFQDTLETRCAKRFEFAFNTNYYVINLEIDEEGYTIESQTRE